MATDFRKISALPPADTLDGTEMVPLVQGGITKRVSSMSIVNDGIPAGFVMQNMGLLTSTGWLDCDASSLSKTTFAPLWNALHTIKGAVTVTIATPAVFTLNSHGLETGDRVYLTTTGALPTGLTSDTTYYTIKINANTFNLATSMANALAGTKINTSGTQSGTHTLVYAPHGVASASDFLLPSESTIAPSLKIGRWTPYPAGTYSVSGVSNNVTIAEGKIPVMQVTSNPTKGSSTVDIAEYKLDGEDLLIHLKYNQSSGGSDGSGSLVIPLPTGYTFKTSPTSSTPSGLSSLDNIGYGTGSFGTNYVIRAVAFGTNGIGFFGTNNVSDVTLSTGAVSGNNGFEVWCRFQASQLVQNGAAKVRWMIHY